MFIRIDFSNFLELVAIPVSFFCSKIELEQGKEFTKKVSSFLTAISILYLALGCLSLTDSFILAILSFLQNYWYIICIYILIMSLLPPLTASRERKKGIFTAEKNYAIKNGLYNLLGAASACAMFRIALIAIEDFSFLGNFYIEGIVSIFIPICGWLVLTYQNIEQKNKNLDHDASTKNLNQKLNMLHLFNVYFLSIISVVFIVSYTMYCYIHNKAITMNFSYYFLLTLMLIFFYALSDHVHRYLYLIFVTMVPVILIASVYWMTWFTMSNWMRGLQWLFLVVHSGIYIILIYRRNRLSAAKEKDNFLLVLLVVVLICYAVIMLIPLFIQRMNGNEAYKYIQKICESTDLDAKQIIEKAREQAMYDEADDSYDIGKYMQFISKELTSPMLDKEIIKNENDKLTYEDLKTWYLNTP